MATYVENNGVVYSDPYTVTRDAGFKITTNMACSIVSITKTSNCDATTGYLWNDAMSELASASFSGDVCTFSSPYALSDATTYYIGCDSEGSNYTLEYDAWGAGNFPIVGTAINWICGMDDGADQAGSAYNLTSATFTTTSPIQFQLADAWKEYTAIKFNLDDNWKVVAAAKQNIGDAWKVIF